VPENDPRIETAFSGRRMICIPRTFTLKSANQRATSRMLRKRVDRRKQLMADCFMEITPARTIRAVIRVAENFDVSDRRLNNKVARDEASSSTPAQILARWLRSRPLHDVSAFCIVRAIDAGAWARRCVEFENGFSCLKS